MVEFQKYTHLKTCQGSQLAPKTLRVSAHAQNMPRYQDLLFMLAEVGIQEVKKSIYLEKNNSIVYGEHEPKRRKSSL